MFRTQRRLHFMSYIGKYLKLKKVYIYRFNGILLPDLRFLVLSGEGYAGAGK